MGNSSYYIYSRCNVAHNAPYRQCSDNSSKPVISATVVNRHQSVFSEYWEKAHECIFCRNPLHFIDTHKRILKYWPPGYKTIKNTVYMCEFTKLMKLNHSKMFILITFQLLSARLVFYSHICNSFWLDTQVYEVYDKYSTNSVKPQSGSQITFNKGKNETSDKLHSLNSFWNKSVTTTYKPSVSSLLLIEKYAHKQSLFFTSTVFSYIYL